MMQTIKTCVADVLPAGVWGAPGVWKEDIKDGSLFPWGWDYISGCCPWIDRPVRTGLSLAHHASGVGSDSGSAPSSSVYTLGLDRMRDWKHASDLSCWYPGASHMVLLLLW